MDGTGLMVLAETLLFSFLRALSEVVTVVVVVGVVADAGGTVVVVRAVSFFNNDEAGTKSFVAVSRSVALVESARVGISEALVDDTGSSINESAIIGESF